MRDVEIIAQVTCPRCGGAGIQSTVESTLACPHCGGEGKVRVALTVAELANELVAHQLASRAKAD